VELTNQAMGRGQADPAWDRAIAEFDKALRLNPGDSVAAMAYLHRGICWNRKGQLTKAIADYDKAIELHPRSYMIWSSKATACMKAGRKQEAIEAWQKVRELGDNTERELAEGMLRILQG